MTLEPLSLKNLDDAESQEFWAFIERCKAEWNQQKPSWLRKLESEAMSIERGQQPEKSHQWAAENCHMLARREIRRLESWRKDGGDVTPIGMAVTTWEHILRICELAGVTGSGVLRETKGTSR